jgi:hypothetical protein
VVAEQDSNVDPGNAALTAVELREALGTLVGRDGRWGSGRVPLDELIDRLGAARALVPDEQQARIDDILAFKQWERVRRGAVESAIARGTPQAEAMKIKPPGPSNDRGAEFMFASWVNTVLDPTFHARFVRVENRFDDAR